MLKKQKNISLSNLFKDHPNKKEIIYLSKLDKDLKVLFFKYPKFKAFKRPKGFEGLIRLITEQQLSVSSARAIFLRIKKLMPIFSPEEFLKIKNSDLSDKFTIFFSYECSENESGTLFEINSSNQVTSGIKIEILNSRPSNLCCFKP